MQKEAVFDRAEGGSFAKVTVGYIKTIALNFIGAYLLSRLQFFGIYLPFGLALACAVPFDMSGISSFAGIVLGLIMIGSDATGLRYISAVIVAVGVRGLLGVSREYKSLKFFTPVLSVTVCFATGMAEIISRYSIPMDYLLLVLECAAAFGLVFVFERVYHQESMQRGTLQSASLMIYASLLLLAGYGIQFLLISPGRIAAIVIILVCARGIGSLGGAITGCVAGLLLASVRPEYAGVGMAFPLCGIAGGLLKGKNKLVLTGLALVVYGVSAPLYIGGVMAELYAEAAIAAAIFLMIPERAERRLKSEISGLLGLEKGKGDAEAQYVKERISKVSKVIGEFMRGGSELGAIPNAAGTYNIAEVFTAASDKICRRCGMASFCWNEDYSSSMAAFNTMSERLKEKGKLTEEDFIQPLSSRCVKKGALLQEVNNLYQHSRLLSQNAIRESARGGEIWAVYRNFAQVLSEIAEESHVGSTLYQGVAEGIRAYFDREGIEAKWVHVLTTPGGNLTVEMLLKDKPLSKEPQMNFFEYLQEMTGKKEFNISVENTSDGYRCLVTEQENYEIVVKSSLLAKQGERQSGDKVAAFKAKDGRYYVILSDGMGSGQAAEKESGFVTAFFTQLVKSGVAVETALKLINNALAAGGPQDYFATADIFVCDLYTGKAELIKAGAAPSVVMRSEKFHEVKSKTLPLGIMGSSDMERTSFHLKDGDAVLVLSDGVADDDGEIRRLEEVYLDIRRFDDCVSRVLAKMQLGRTRDDDMTMVEIKVRQKEME